MSEPTYTAEQREAAAKKVVLGVGSSGYGNLACDLQCALTATEQREKELLSQLAAIRDAPEAELTLYHPACTDTWRAPYDGKGMYFATDVDLVLTTLTRQNKALKLELTGRIKASSSEPRQRLDDVKD